MIKLLDMQINHNIQLNPQTHTGILPAPLFTKVGKTSFVIAKKNYFYSYFFTFLHIENMGIIDN